MSTVEQNKAIARRTWEEIFPACDVAALAEVTDEHVDRPRSATGRARGLEGVTRTMLWLGSVSSVQRWEVHEVFGDGDRWPCTPRITVGRPAN